VVINECITFIGCVLHHQGDKVTSQPIILNDSMLLWNGENYDVCFSISRMYYNYLEHIWK